jgi:ankyrin repeat protein
MSTKQLTINGRTALMFAAERGCLNGVRYLVKECGANVNDTDRNGSQPGIVVWICLTMFGEQAGG